MNDNVVFVDLQGFKSNSNHFIAKEVAVVFNSKEHINFIIKPPFDFQYLSPKKQKEANWLTNNYHHLKWSDGSVSYRSTVKFLRTNISHAKIYVKGEEKRKWLELMLKREIFNIENVGCINFNQLDMKCPEYLFCIYHNYGVCALRNARLLAKEITCLDGS